jgi:uncharacterized protein (TIGR02246 family)
VSDEATIRETFDRIIEIMEDGDTEAVAEIWTSDAVVLPPGQPAMAGKETIANWYREVLGSQSIEYEGHTVEEIVVTGDVAFSRAEVRGRMVSKCCGESREFNNKAIHIWNRQADGSWLLARAMYNGNN